MSPAESWLKTHIPAAPVSLLSAMTAALEPGDIPVPQALAAAALRRYREFTDGAGGREDALILLAADALLTHAFEAQAEVNPEAVADLASRLGAGGQIGKLAHEAA
ncbi:MAG TPA: hypothetical protein VFI91_00020 [Longimicrobiaceae bacterium]|nr:hypothetical protein [Longimicrobiaceae bacterium]